MYLWVLLITFISLLYSYNLSVRGDERKIGVEPLAEAAISSFALHHRMGQQYIKERSPKTIDNPYGTNGETISYTKGILDYDALENYKPVGFQINDSYQTEIYCAKRDNWSTAVADCTSDDADKILITYGPIPERWLNRSSNTPNNDFMNALSNLFDIDNTIGYAVPSRNSTVYKMELQGREDSVVYLPNLVVTSGGFKEKCACENCKRCLVYMSVYE